MSQNLYYYGLDWVFFFFIVEEIFERHLTSLGEKPGGVGLKPPRWPSFCLVGSFGTIVVATAFARSRLLRWEMFSLFLFFLFLQLNGHWGPYPRGDVVGSSGPHPVPVEPVFLFGLPSFLFRLSEKGVGTLPPSFFRPWKCGGPRDCEGPSRDVSHRDILRWGSCYPWYGGGSYPSLRHRHPSLAGSFFSLLLFAATFLAITSSQKDVIAFCLLSSASCARITASVTD